MNRADAADLTCMKLEYRARTGHSYPHSSLGRYRCILIQISADMSALRRAMLEPLPLPEFKTAFRTERTRSLEERLYVVVVAEGFALRGHPVGSFRRRTNGAAEKGPGTDGPAVPQGTRALARLDRSEVLAPLSLSLANPSLSPVLATPPAGIARGSTCRSSGGPFSRFLAAEVSLAMIHSPDDPAAVVDSSKIVATGRVWTLIALRAWAERSCHSLRAQRPRAPAFAPFLATMAESSLHKVSARRSTGARLVAWGVCVAMESTLRGPAAVQPLAGRAGRAVDGLPCPRAGDGAGTQIVHASGRPCGGWTDANLVCWAAQIV